jgi:hypothetical protein
MMQEIVPWRQISRKTIEKDQEEARKKGDEETAKALEAFKAFVI